MKNIAARIIVCLVLMLAGIGSQIHAQEISIVSGKILNLPEGKNKPEPFPLSERVYIFVKTKKPSHTAMVFCFHRGGRT